MESPRSSAGAVPATMIARGVKVEGDFTSQGDVVIEGEVHGTLSTTQLLTVGPEAKIKADVKAQDAIVSGTIEGNVTATNRVELKSTAKIIGDINAESVSIEAGAAMSGRMNIGMKAVAAENPFAGQTKRERASATSAAAA